MRDIPTPIWAIDLTGGLLKYSLSLSWLESSEAGYSPWDWSDDGDGPIPESGLFVRVKVPDPHKPLSPAVCVSLRTMGADPDVHDARFDVLNYLFAEYIFFFISVVKTKNK